MKVTLKLCRAHKEFIALDVTIVRRRLFRKPEVIDASYVRGHDLFWYSLPNWYIAGFGMQSRLSELYQKHLFEAAYD